MAERAMHDTLTFAHIDGANCQQTSTKLNAPIDNFPPEILVAIFLFLHFWDIVTCQAVSKRFREIITSTPALQYAIELGVAGYTDLPSLPELGIVDRLARLVKYRGARKRVCAYSEHVTNVCWSTAAELRYAGDVFVHMYMDGIPDQPEFIDTHAFDLIDVLHLSNAQGVKTKTLRLFQLFEGLVLDPAQDLLVLWERRPFDNEGRVVLYVTSLSHDLTVDNAPLVVELESILRDIAARNDAQMAVSISGQCIVLYVTPSEKSFAEVVVVDWTSRETQARTRLRHPGRNCRYEGFVVLPDNRFAIALYATSASSSRQYQTSMDIELYGFTTSSDEERGITHLATFQLPELHRDAFPSKLSLTSSATPGSYAPRSHYRPFNQSSSATMLVIGMDIMNMTKSYLVPSDQFDIVIPMSSVLSVLGRNSGASGPQIFRWDSWGPKSTRWTSPRSTGWKWRNVASGYELVKGEYLLDFNPVDIARDLCRRAQDPKSNLPLMNMNGVEIDREDLQLDEYGLVAGIADPVIITTPHIIDCAHMFVEDVVSELPFRQTRLLPLEDWDTIYCGGDILRLERNLRWEYITGLRMLSF